MRAWLLLVLVACEHDPKRGSWSATRTAEVNVGPFAVRVPAGWRDAIDLQDRSRKPDLAFSAGSSGPHPLAEAQIRLPDDAHAFLPEDLVGDQVIGLHVKEAPAGTGCDEFSTEYEKFTLAIVKPRTLGGDLGCQWTIAAPNGNGLALARFHGTHLLLAFCKEAAERASPRLEAACLESVESARVR